MCHHPNPFFYIRFRTDGSLFNLARLRAQTKTSMDLVQELLYADDCGIFAHSEDDLQLLMNNFVRASKSFGLTISIQKTEVLYQPVPGTIYFKPQITVEDAALKVTNVFTYLGSKIANDGQLDTEINCRIAKASASFGKLHSRVWSSHDLKLNTKVEVYNVVVLSTLLYAAETWTLYQRHIKKLEAFHQRCLRAICGIKWQNLVSDLEVLQRCKTISIETNIRHRQLRWCGHIARMSDQRLAKQLLYGELKTGKRPQGRSRKRYKDEV